MTRTCGLLLPVTVFAIFSTAQAEEQPSVPVANAETSGPGPTWQNLGPGGGGWIQSICASPHDRDELFVGCDVGGFYHSLDGGRSYRISNVGLEDYWVECIVPHPRDPNTIYLGCESGVYRSTNRGKTWCWLREGFPPTSQSRWTAPIGALVIDPDSPDTLFAGIGRPRMHDYGKGAVYKTTDGGLSWSSLNGSGLTCKQVVSITIDPHDPDRLYLGTGGNGVFVGRVRQSRTTETGSLGSDSP